MWEAAYIKGTPKIEDVYLNWSSEICWNQSGPPTLLSLWYCLNPWILQIGFLLPAGSCLTFRLCLAFSSSESCLDKASFLPLEAVGMLSYLHNHLPGPTILKFPQTFQYFGFCLFQWLVCFWALDFWLVLLLPPFFHPLLSCLLCPQCCVYLVLTQCRGFREPTVSSEVMTPK